MRSLRFSVLPGTFAVVRLPPDAELPEGALSAQFRSATRTATELSLVCPDHAVPDGVRAETGWAVLALEGPFPFDLVGVLAAFLVPLAAAGVGIFAMSTFDTDYVLVKREKLDVAVGALTAAGHEHVGDRPAGKA